MKGHRIMNASGYAAPLQMVKKAIPVSGAEHVQVVDMLGARPCHRRDNFLKSAELPVILRRPPPSRNVPFVEVRQLHAEDSRLQLVKPRVHAGDRKRTRLNSRHSQNSYAVF